MIDAFIPNLSSFDQLQLSRETQEALKKNNFVELTEIQKRSLPHSLSGKDVLGAARTGSGKTLAFVVPLLEQLHRKQWSQLDGLGALIVSPTRELALQIFTVLRKVGSMHRFSAGLLIGGKDLKQEQMRVNQMNILVATPGRLLQHMDQTPDFHCDALQMLVLDEADRILDCGFAKTLNAIIANLPKNRQTLLFSATQTKSINDLARLSLSSPEYVSVHHDATPTPQMLSQHYAIVDLPSKLDTLFSFIRAHLNQKMIVFMSSCKQVRFVYETFCKMQPGMPLMCLHGKQKQPKRMAIFEQFCRKQEACLFATDIAARGLDFPLVNWVVQLDCPEDVATYIHRVGRTARYESSGHALLLLLPSETAFVDLLTCQSNIPIKQIHINPLKAMSIQPQLAALCSQAPDIKYLAQKALVCYLRSVHVMANKQVFNVAQMPVEAFAASLGLPGAPKIKFVSNPTLKNASRQQLQPDSDDSEDNHVSTNAKPRTKVDRMFDKKNLTVLSTHYRRLQDVEEENEDSDSFLTLTRKDHTLDTPTAIPASKPSHRQILKQKRKALTELGKNKKYVFDEEGVAVDAYKMETLEEFERERGVSEREKEYLDVTLADMRAADAVDRVVEKEKVSGKKRIKKLKEREMRREQSGASNVAMLGGGSDDESIPEPKRSKTQLSSLNRESLEDMALELLN